MPKFTLPLYGVVLGIQAIIFWGAISCTGTEPELGIALTMSVPSVTEVNYLEASV
jgi:hypothetical protein